RLRGIADQYEVRLRSRSGEAMWVQVSGAPIFDASGTPIGSVGIHTDITEKRKLEEELRRAGKLESLGVLAGGLAHDFNNLLTGIVGNISLAKSRARPDDNIYHRLTEAEYACFRARDLTQQLLTFSKGGAPIMRTASIAELLRESASFAVTGSNTRCVFEIGDDLWPVEVDEGQMSQVVHNLALNSQQAMPDGGLLTIRAQNVTIPPRPSGNAASLAGGRYVVISVIDGGSGIPEENLEKIFDPYFTTKPKGSGLGLATCYSIIRNHGGHIDVESRPGAGAKFSVFLPASVNPLPAPVAGRVRLPAGTGRILLMDDEEIIRTVTGDILAQLGYEVSVVCDGAEAVELYHAAMRVGRPFDAVILDLTVPGGIGGKETIEKLREIDPTVRAVVSSGYSNDPIMADFKAYGFSGVAAKPYRVEDLRQILDEVMLNPGR
ncbi:MAG TPA: ATP-binding protein, partial [Blastocatellia bacterium]|nr:ATP-binding protein [Blastocatellia bacterium]